MGRRGPVPIPTSVKEKNGNPGKRKLNKSEVKPKAVNKKPACPTWINSQGKAFYNKMFPKLKAENLITENDMETFYMLCSAYGNYVLTQITLNKQGRTYEAIGDKGQYMLKENPLVKMEATYFNQFRQMIQHFGLSVAERSRLNIDKQEENPLQDLMQNFQRN